MMQYLTLSDMRGQVGRFVGDTTSNRNTKIDEWLNLHYGMDFALRHRWPQLMRGQEQTLTPTVGTPFFYLPKDVGQLYFMIRGDPIGETPHQTIEKFFLRQMDFVDVGGRLITYADAGEFGRRAEFSATAEKLTIQNVGAAGGEAITAIVQGMVTISGSEKIEVIESVALTGTTAADTTNTFSDLIQVSASGSQTGYLTVTGKTSTTLYATVEPGERTARYKRLRLGYTPEGDTVTIYYKKSVRRLTSDYQAPEIPVSGALVEKTVASMFMNERKWQGAGSMHDQRAETLLATAFAESNTQASRIEQAVPLVSRPGRGHGDVIVVSAV